MNWSPFTLSLWVSFWSGTLALACGVWLGWLIVKRRFPGKFFLEGMILIPLVIPPTVLGFFLLTIFGARGLGGWLENALGFSLVFTWRAAVIASAIAALPLVVQTTRAGFAETSQEIEDAARVDGCSGRQLFWLIDLPIAWRSITAGGLLGFLRAFGEFGATLMVAGNIPGQTQTLSIAVYDAVQSNNIVLAAQLTLILSGLAFGLLYLSLYINRQVPGKS